MKVVAFVGVPDLKRRRNMKTKLTTEYCKEIPIYLCECHRGTSPDKLDKIKVFFVLVGAGVEIKEKICVNDYKCLNCGKFYRILYKHEN